MMSDWVHCNTCFNQPGKASGRKFALTNCGHIYCDVCLIASTKDKCKMCGANCTSITLSAKMKPDVEIFFSDPSDVAKKHLKQLTQVIDFQKNHRKRLTSFLREKAQREHSLLAQSQKTTGQIQELDREMRKVREENMYLKKLINDTGINAGRGGGSRPGSTTPGTTHYKASPTGRTVNTSPCNKAHSLSSLQRHTPTNRGPMPMSQDARNNAMQISPCTTPTTGRVSLRTPPSHGRMGVIPGNDKTPSMRSMFGTPNNGALLQSPNFSLIQTQTPK